MYPWLIVAVLLFFPSLGESAVFLESNGDIVMECHGGKAGNVSCRANKERLAKYVKCHEQMKDAMRLMNEFIPLHSEDELALAAKIPQDEQDEAITFWRDTLERCVGD